MIDIAGSRLSVGDICLYSKSSAGTLIVGVVCTITDKSVVLHNSYEKYKTTQYYKMPRVKAYTRLLKLNARQIAGLSTAWKLWFQDNHPELYRKAVEADKSS